MQKNKFDQIWMLLTYVGFSRHLFKDIQGNYKSDVKIAKFKIVIPIWRMQKKKFSQICMLIVYIGLSRPLI